MLTLRTLSLPGWKKWLLRVGRAPLFSHHTILEAGVSWDPGISGWEIIGPLPVLHAGALRLLRRNSGETRREALRRVQRHWFHRSVNNPAYPATSFLELASSPLLGKPRF